MAQPIPLAELLADARLAGLVAVPTPALLFDAETRLLFANPAGLALAGAKTLREARDAAALAPFAEAARRFSESLAPGGAARLERFRLKSALQPAVFACSRIDLADARAAVLFAGMEAGRGKPPTLADAARALLDEDAFALFDLDGRLLHLSPAAGALLRRAETIAEMEPAASAAFEAARGAGAADVSSGAMRIAFRKIGTKAQPAMLAIFAAKDRAEDERPKAAAAEAARGPAPGREAPQPAKASTRFVWQTDAGGRFIGVSDDLAAMVGGKNAEIEGLDWTEAARRIGIEGVGEVAAAIARRDTWSGVIVRWPAAHGDFVQIVELAALPVFDRARQFQGYRGFGVFREKAAPAAKERPVLVERAENVVPLRAPLSAEARAELSASERTAFREIAREIGARIDEVNTREDFGKRPAPAEAPAAPAGGQEAEARISNGERALLDRLPLGVVVHRGGRVLYANRTALEWIGLADVGTLEAEGGLNRLFAGIPTLEPNAPEAASALALVGKSGEPIPVEARLISVPWETETALTYVLRRAGAGLDERMETAGLQLREAEAAHRELRSILDTATDGVVLLDREGTILGMNRSAEALFGYDAAEVEGENFTRLFAPESHRAAIDYLDGLAQNGVASLLNDGREVIGQVREGGLIPLFMTVGRVAEGSEKFCGV
ncbi:MAG TPA: PAS domain-containing protein, partial [Xanthobacteraceae bacterium]|nr:PAS domain-containing protein [Xanthobacteraceae bacterium]